MNRSLLAVPFMLASLVLGGCGGGGGGSGGASGDTASASSATVGVLITDAPVGRWDEALATIRSVVLIGDRGQVTLFEGEQTLDLLKLGDFSELFAVSDSVPPGRYNKIRLQLDDLVLNDRDDDGDLVESVRPQLVGNGKIDLNPRGDFLLAGGDVIVIELDFDMEKSLKITETGNGRLIVRPVVFVDIRTETPPDGRLTRIYGEITRLDPGGMLELCQRRFASNSDDDDDDDDDRRDTLRRCITVDTDEKTGVFGTNGLPQPFGELSVGGKITAIGRLRPTDEDEDDDDDDESRGDDDDERYRFVLDAYVIEEGPLGTFRRLRGLVATDFDPVAGRFGLDLAPGQGLESEEALPVRIFEESRIFDGAGLELDPTALVAGRPALADGVLVLGADDVLRSPLVILREVDAGTSAALEGEIVSVDQDEETLLVNDGTMDRCVDAASARIFLVDDDDGFSSSRGDIDDLDPGQAVAIFGTEGVDGCFIAETILAEDD
jgi:hypothetical protein